MRNQYSTRAMARLGIDSARVGPGTWGRQRGRPLADGHPPPPGRELQRLTPRNNDELLFDGIPWVERAQAEHDAFAEQLRERDVEVLYLHELLAETLEADAAREQLLDAALRPQDIGPTLAPALREHLRGLPRARARRRC